MGSDGSIRLDDISAETWDSLGAPWRTPMQGYIWLQAYSETLASGPVRVFCIGPHSRPAALAPFASSLSGPRQLTLLGAEDIWESVEVLAETDHAMDELARTLVESGQALRFGHYPSDTGFLGALERHSQSRAVFAKRPFDGRAMPAITLGPKWQDPESQVSSRRRADVRRMRRIANEMGKVTFEICAPEAPEARDLVDEAFSVEARNWKGRAGSAILSDANKAAFYRTYAGYAAQRGWLRLGFMRIDGVAVAMQIAVQWNNRYWLLKIGYDEACKRCSPGNLLFCESVRYAAEAGLISYELLGKESDWTKLWTEHARPISSARVYPFNVSGAAALATDAAQALRKRALRPSQA